MGHLVALWWCESLWCREREARHMKSSREKRAAAAFCKCVAWVSCKQFEFSILFIFMYSDPKKIESKILVKLWEFTVLTFGRMTEICIYIYLYTHILYMYYLNTMIYSEFCSFDFWANQPKGTGGKEKWWPEVLTSLEWWFMVYVSVHLTYIHTLCNDVYNDGFKVQSQGFGDHL
jgi:hypothetical protein